MMLQKLVRWIKDHNCNVGDRTSVAVAVVGLGSRYDLNLAESISISGFRLRAFRNLQKIHSPELYFSVIINSDALKGIDKCIGDILSFRASHPTVPLILASSEAGGNDSSSHRSILCDSTISLPTSPGAVSFYLQQAHHICMLKKLHQTQSSKPIKIEQL